MRLGTVLIGLFALVFGGSAAAGVYLLIKPEAKTDAEKTSIVVAVANVPRGVTLTADMFETRPWANDYVPQGAIKRLEDVEGRTVSIPMIKNEPVVEAKLADPKAGRGMAALIPQGMRAVTIQTPNVSTGVAGFILPGNKVDVLFTQSQAHRDDDTGGGSTVTLLQNVEILAVDQRIEAPHENVVDPRELQSVTLLVNPEQAATLDLGQNKGTLRLSLRNPEDTNVEEVEMATLAALRLRKAGPFLSPQPPAASRPGPVDPDELEQGSPKPTAPEPVLLPIRTLRGTTAGMLHVRQVPIGAAQRPNGTP